MPARALQHRLEQIADDADGSDREAEHERAPAAARRGSHHAPEQRQHERRADEAADAPSTVFFGLIDGREQAAAERAARSSTAPCR